VDSQYSARLWNPPALPLVFAWALASGEISGYEDGGDSPRFRLGLSPHLRRSRTRVGARGGFAGDRAYCRLVPPLRRKNVNVQGSGGCVPLRSPRRVRSSGISNQSRLRHELLRGQCGHGRGGRLRSARFKGLAGVGPVRARHHRGCARPGRRPRRAGEFDGRRSQRLRRCPRGPIRLQIVLRRAQLSRNGMERL